MEILGLSYKGAVRPSEQGVHVPIPYPAFPYVEKGGAGLEVFQKERPLQRGLLRERRNHCVLGPSSHIFNVPVFAVLSMFGRGRAWAPLRSQAFPSFPAFRVRTAPGGFGRDCHKARE